MSHYKRKRKRCKKKKKSGTSELNSLIIKFVFLLVKLWVRLRAQWTCISQVLRLSPASHPFLY